MAVLRDLGSSIAERRIPKARALQHARRQYLAHRRDGPRSARGVRSADLCAARLWRHFHSRPRAAGASLRLSRGRSGNGALCSLRCPNLVDRSAYTVNYIADVAKPELLLPENAPATFAWLTRDIAPSGVLGDPRPATAENGARWIEQKPPRIWPNALQAMFRYPDSPTP